MLRRRDPPDPLRDSALAAARRPFGLPRAPLRGARRGRRDGPRDPPLRDFAELYRVLPPCRVGRRPHLSKIFGPRGSGARQYAVDLGVALQLTNIVRDIPVYLSRGRLYLPHEDCARMGCTEADLSLKGPAPDRGVRSAAVQALLRHQAERRAPPSMALGASALPRGDWRSLVAAEIMGAIRSRAARPDRAGAATMCSLRGPDPTLVPGAHRRGHSGPDRAPPVTSRYDVIVIGGGFAGSERRLRAERSAARRSWWLDARPSSAGARPRSAIARLASWSRRSARAVRVLPRDAGVPAIRAPLRIPSGRRPALELACYDWARRRSVLRAAVAAAAASARGRVRRWPAIPWSERFAALRLAGRCLRPGVSCVRLRWPLRTPGSSPLGAARLSRPGARSRSGCGTRWRWRR